MKNDSHTGPSANGINGNCNRPLAPRGAEQALGAGVLLRIDRGERHELRNTGSGPLRTLSLYVPPLTAG
ncbi:hypothetical protein [Longimicrobium sp.]|uniref:hypothetical protein n=1 Tax=Longimicrobium sp. TaxID=2029185 RepID=UPI002E32E90A|nr:hypothetical protein [Longimicrobium sp.]HEX6037823.1 hypothetical protein [Longimicrobium sp.]